MSSPASIITSDPSLAGYLPKDFCLGFASASHQIEGAIDKGGKGEGLWDKLLSHKKGDNGEDACGSYEHWREDLDLVQKYGGNCYRFSISWPRIIPQGGRNDPINEEGVKYYSDLIDELLRRGIEPVVTIFHWDHPQALEDRYGGFWNEEEIVADFVNYSKVLFERFGDRVSKWITFNEPHIFTMRMSMLWGKEEWNVQTDYTRLARTITLLHAYTVDLYRRDYQPNQKGTIGITLNIDWNEPFDESPEAKEAALITLETILGLYADPIFVGEYTERLKKEYGDALPKYSEEEMKLVKGSSDFFGLNHYCTAWTTGRRFTPKEAGPPGWLWSFGRTEKVYEKDGKPIGTPGLGGHLCSVPWGLRKNLVYIHERYTKASGIAIWITENGFPVDGEADIPLEKRLEDTPRQEYFAGYLKAMLDAMREDGVKMGGYMAWSLLDNLEWERGYAPRFGLTVVERDNGFKRHSKKSAFVLRDIYKHLLGN